MHKDLHIDIETYSPEDLASTGVYRYAEHPDFRVLLVCYAFGDEPVRKVETGAGEDLPEEFLSALTDPTVRKWAHNAVFERVCLSRYLELPEHTYLDPAQWHCTMVLCARCGLPLSLKDAGAELGLEEQKMTEGRRLIQLFCKPHARTQGLFNHGTRALPEDFPDEWKTFGDYCVRDVEVERELHRRLGWLAVPESENAAYTTDQRINDRGVLIDRRLAESAVRAVDVERARLSAEAQGLTGLSNPNSPTQLKEWLGRRLGHAVEGLTKKDMPGLIEETAQGSPERRVLEIRAEMGKTSCAKYTAMLECACSDDRVRGLFQFHGSRTGRWAGKLVQMQNLPQNHIDGLDFARNAAREGDSDLLRLCYGSVQDTLSQLIRTAFVAPEGQTLAVCDFSAIEARVIAWLAGEDWVLDVFRTHGKIYEATAAQMYHCDIDDITKTDPRRQKGKIAVLALGYGGGVSALEAMGGKRMGLGEDEMGSIVADWRQANPNIVALWRTIERAVDRASRFGTVEYPQGGLLSITRQHDCTVITLPSGRSIAYPRMTRGEDGKLAFRGTEQATKKYGWVPTYGGKLTENIVQAIARDCLVETMGRVEAAGIRIVAHVHDELICEVPDESRLRELKDIFATPIDWAPGLPLRGAGYCTPYYLKD